MTNEQEKDDLSPEDRFQMKCGVTLAVFASIMAITDLGGAYSDYGMNYAQAEKANAFAWYNSKGIKQSLAEGQRDTLEALLIAGVIDNTHAAPTRDFVAVVDRKITRYEQEKQEILLGSAAVGEKNWAQEVDGKRGQVTGAKEWEAESDAYGSVSEIFDLANLVLQICLVIGAISLVVRTQATRKLFYGSSVGLGMGGAGIGIYAILRYFAV